ncbi:MAG: tRNA epoxyqueuosine(34) reductase QueG [Tabrizicola sp.]|uniref:tRNA epoxyqueuosine(34) reductase QueG n=1 Tax=Tabrizicola sp. TaxID=2005166 RepID=UPI002733A3E6|nr:tRNA epoxyqueuosine(34) reductase QueG [Tabrizicola sp.]MDP3261547.1 tRNA epoxyqueuosine(34) reductase QueG [Tabrizicola sp.]MDP3648384.1 tRNA epoxyqueuosine(34) reductase QueG [Paracoccaceae bacterium]MDZ4065380.1 tRNA epoxyqueuosine(34) reductase QueG [Tabrizicola sp.]
MHGLKDRLVERALQEGFAKLGVCRPDAVPGTAARLRAWLEAGRHGQMGWMAEREGWRGNAAALWPEARSVVMLAEAYSPDSDPMAGLAEHDRGVVSVYAQGRDYHDLVKRRLKRLGRWLLDQSGGEIKVFVDTAPVMEKPLAQAAGLGWQGKHTNLLGRDLGNWVFLGAIFTTLDLEPDAAEVSHCGSCTACLDVCPTAAFPAPYQLDARRCISYLTIEHKGPVDPELRGLMGNRIYGCDDCLAVCPWNKFAVAAREIGYQPKVGLPALADLAGLDDAGFRARFAGSPIKRIGRDRFVRNVMYAIGNSAAGGLLPVAQRLTGDPDPAVADAARWAVLRLTVGKD